MALATARHIRPNKHRALVVNISDIDPTRTLVLRRQFSAQMTNRFRALKGAINRKIIDEDFLGAHSGVNRLDVTANFEYTWGAQKAEAFMGWFVEAELFLKGFDEFRVEPLRAPIFR